MWMLNTDSSEDSPFYRIQLLLRDFILQNKRARLPHHNQRLCLQYGSTKHSLRQRQAAVQECRKDYRLQFCTLRQPSGSKTDLYCSSAGSRSGGVAPPSGRAGALPAVAKHTAVLQLTLQTSRRISTRDANGASIVHWCVQRLRAQ